jgi:hypothetical protein
VLSVGHGVLWQSHIVQPQHSLSHPKIPKMSSRASLILTIDGGEKSRCVWHSILEVSTSEIQLRVNDWFCKDSGHQGKAALHGLCWLFLRDGGRIVCKGPSVSLVSNLRLHLCNSPLDSLPFQTGSDHEGFYQMLQSQIISGKRNELGGLWLLYRQEVGVLPVCCTGPCWEQFVNAALKISDLRSFLKPWCCLYFVLPDWMWP